MFFRDRFSYYFGIWYDRKSWSNQKYFRLTIKPYVVYEKCFYFFKIVNHLLSLNLSFSNRQTTTEVCLNTSRVCQKLLALSTVARLAHFSYEPNVKKYF
jgi:hypothetical protein